VGPPFLLIDRTRIIHFIKYIYNIRVCSNSVRYTSFFFFLKEFFFFGDDSSSFFLGTIKWPEELHKV